MSNSKIFIILTDGVGFRNFAYTDFFSKGKAKGLDIVFWNSTPFGLKELGYEEIKIENAKSHPLTDILKKARVQIELNLNIKKFNDPVYDGYRFPFSYRNVTAILKSFTIRCTTFLYSSDKGIKKIRKHIFKFEKNTRYYQNCLEVLRKEKPDMVFCTSQRSAAAIAPILAAQELKIPTATFIFSWDNLPKATLVLEPDYYFVWSDFMKTELLKYYPFIQENQIVITGTPQFEFHANEKIIESKATFLSKYHLDSSKKYICYSGDDITTSPNDPQYLEDTATAVRKLNAKGYDLGIIFRRCPVDFSDRFGTALERNKDIITAIDPKWEKAGMVWNMILPTLEDTHLQMNTIAHTEMVINLGSTMVFDYVSFKKPCAFINYDVPTKKPNLSVNEIYKFIHFQSMPSQESVLWINTPESIAEVIVKGLENNQHTIENAQLWFDKINLQPAKDASERIVTTIENIVSNSKK